MTLTKYQVMNLDELRGYVLNHQDDVEAFHTYVDRSKSEGRMNKISPNDENWEEKVIQAITYSTNSIRWYCDTTEKYQQQAQIITEWWRNLDHKTVIRYHTERIKLTGISGWKPDKLDQPVKLRISEPSIEETGEIAFVKYKNEDNTINRIETIAIDLDIDKQNLFVWPSYSSGVFIFSLENV